MRHILKRVMVLAAALMIVLAAVAAPADADETKLMDDEGLFYEVKTDTETGEQYAVITDCLYIIPDLVIPSTIGGYPVREVAAEFTSLRIGWDTGLETLTVEEGVRSIGASAFANMLSLRRVTLPESLLEIGESAFANCTALEQVTLPASLAHVGLLAFVNIGMEGLTFPESVAEAKTNFLYCSTIRKDKTGNYEYGLQADGTAVITNYKVESEELVIPEAVDGIPVTMVVRAPLEKIDFTTLRKIKTLTLPESLRTIGHLAFEHFGGLTQVTIPGGVIAIELGAFRDCPALTSVILPEGLRRIGEGAFSNCSALAMPVLPSTLEEIGPNAFYACMKFSEITLPGSVRIVGDLAFSDCKTKKLTLNEGLETIGYKAFYNNKLTDVDIPSSVKQIGDGVFQPADNKFLQSVTVRSMRTEFGKGVFGYDDGWQAFYLEHKDELNIASTLFDKDDLSNWHDYYAEPTYFSQKSINFSCYSGSTADLKYQYYVNKTSLKGSADNVSTASADRVLQAGLYKPEDLLTELIIPEGVEEIADHALEGLGTLAKVTLPSTLVRIGAYAFDRCVGLTEITLPDSVTEIGEGAFRDCWELAKINIPEEITEIRDSTFENCRKMTAATLPKAGIVRFGKSAFSGCEQLGTVKFEKGLEEIGESAFANCGLKEANLPDTVVSVGKKAFARSNLKKLKLPAGLEIIPEGLCEYATELESVTLPKTLKQIEKNAFTWCALKSVTLPEGLERIGENAFGFDPDRSLANYRESKHKKHTSQLKTVKFPASLKVIEAKAFAGCDSLSSVTFPKKSVLTEIGDDAFAMCLRMTKFAAPDSLQKIGKGAFRMCLSMTSADLGKGLAEAQDEAFFNCIKLEKLIAPATLTVIGKDLLTNYGSKLKVTCVEGSAVHDYMKAKYPGVKLTLQKKKK